MTTWDDELFVHSYTWHRTPTSYAFLGNGRLSAFFDFSGIAQPDGFWYRPIRRKRKAVGVFRLFVGLHSKPGSHIYIASASRADFEHEVWPFGGHKEIID